MLIISNISATTTTDFEKVGPNSLESMETKIAIKSKNKDFDFERVF
jgi:hypothetical protein